MDFLNTTEPDRHGDISLSAEIMTLDETATLLRVSKPTLLDLAQSRRIPARQVGRIWRFRRSIVLSWVAGSDCGLRSKKGSK
jgi:excisionase family DNA binding protein